VAGLECVDETAHSDGVISALNQQGNARYNPIESAPGRDAKAKSQTQLSETRRSDPDLNSLFKEGHLAIEDAAGRARRTSHLANDRFAP
jgi:hypothetical protein